MDIKATVEFIREAIKVLREENIEQVEIYDEKVDDLEEHYDIEASTIAEWSEEKGYAEATIECNKYTINKLNKIIEMLGEEPEEYEDCDDYDDEDEDEDDDDEY